MDNELRPDQVYSWEPVSTHPYKVIKWDPYDWPRGCCSPIVKTVIYAPTLEMALDQVKSVWDGQRPPRIRKLFLGLYCWPVSTAQDKCGD